MKHYWGSFINKLNSMSLRERVLVFSAAAFILVALVKVLFLDPLLVEQKKISTKLTQQQQMMKALQAQTEASIQARTDFEKSPMQQRLELAKQQLEEGNNYLQERRDRLVAPEQMVEVLENVLNQNGRLRLINLHTSPVVPLKMAKSGAVAVLDKQIFKHEVQMTVRGSYLDLMQYMTELEQLPTQMLWGKADIQVMQHPDVELKLTLYTLSLDRTWLKI